MEIRTNYSDEEMIAAIKEALEKGVKPERVADKLQPNNLLAFFHRLPRPERDRLVGEAMKE